MLKIFFWLRYLRKKRIVFFSIKAVGLSVALLVVVSSLFGGFIGEFEQSAIDVMGDVIVEPPEEFAKYHLFIQGLEQIEGVEAATATLSGHGLLHLGKGNVRAVNVLGIEPEKRAQVTGFKHFLLGQRELLKAPSFEVDESSVEQAGFVGIGVVAEPDEKTDEYDFDAIKRDVIGRKVILTTGSGKDLKRRNVVFSIVDVVFTGIYDIDKSFVYLPIEILQAKLHSEQPVADQIQVRLKAGADSDVVLDRINRFWRDFASGELGWNSYRINSTKIVTSGQMQSQYVAEIKKQMGILLFIFGIISLSAVLLIFCILYMIVESRLKDIAILKSCGASGCSVASIFVGFGGCIGIAGSALGVALGYLITKNINTVESCIRIIFGLKLWKSSVYMFSTIPNQVCWHSAGNIVILAVIAAAAGALIPAVIAGRTSPVNILRYE